jgi:urease beta subunit
MIPGEILVEDGEIELNLGRPTVQMRWQIRAIAPFKLVLTFISLK